METLKGEYKTPYVANPLIDEIIKINVNGTDEFSVHIDTLISVENSLLSELFSDMDNFKRIDDKVFLDRDPEAFRLLLLWLRNDRVIKPTFENMFQRTLFDQEVEYWKIDKIQG